MLPVDPQAAFSRAELEGHAPIAFDRTHVEVNLLPPLAQIVVVRHFTNRSDRNIEAVLTLPPLARQEVVYRLAIYIGGVHCEASSQPAIHGRRKHDLAVADGRRAILYELIEHDLQMITIAGIEPGHSVEVQIWSIKPLEQPEQGRAQLFIPLSACHEATMSSFNDADALVTTRSFHAATLAVGAYLMHVRLCGQGEPYDIVSRDPISVDCAAPIQLDILPQNNRSLDHSAWQVDKVGGWEVTSERGIETFRHPMNPTGTLISNRTDWIYGVMATVQGEIRVTAPLPTDDIAPNARAMRAFAAAAFTRSATPQESDAVRRTANILSHENNLAFIGSESECSKRTLVRRKLALPEIASSKTSAAPMLPTAPAPCEGGDVP